MSTGDPGAGTDVEGADETGGGLAAAEHCLFEPVDGRYGYRYQCAGSITIGVSIEGTFPGSPVTDDLALEFGHGVDGDSYDEPHVMACCPAYDLAALPCEQDHKRACLIDLVDQGCKSMVTNLEDFAYDEFGAPGELAERNAVLKIADHVRHHQQDCVDRFWGDTQLSSTASTCDMDGNGPPFEAMLESGAWSFDPDGLVVSNVQIAVQVAEWTDLHPLEGSPDVCWSMHDNDGVLFLEIDPDPEAKVVHLVAGRAAFHGPSLEGEQIEGAGALGPASSLALLSDPGTGSASLENLELHSAGAAELRIGGESVVIERFQVRLWDSTPAMVDDGGETLTIPPGHARFAVSARAMDMNGVNTALNTTAIVITRVHDGWMTSGFTIDHRDDASEAWSLVILPGRWE